MQPLFCTRSSSVVSSQDRRSETITDCVHSSHDGHVRASSVTASYHIHITCVWYALGAVNAGWARLLVERDHSLTCRRSWWSVLVPIMKVPHTHTFSYLYIFADNAFTTVVDRPPRGGNRSFDRLATNHPLFLSVSYDTSPALVRACYSASTPSPQFFLRFE